MRGFLASLGMTSKDGVLRARWWRGRAIVFSSEAESSTLRAVWERSIWRRRPERTRPGPISMKGVALLAMRTLMQSTQRTGAVTWRMRQSRASAARVMQRASTLAMTG